MLKKHAAAHVKNTVFLLVESQRRQMTVGIAQGIRLDVTVQRAGLREFMTCEVSSSLALF